VEVDFDEGLVLRLRGYVGLVTEALGLTGECSCFEVGRPMSAYLALDGRLSAYPDWDVALLWDEERGWAVAVEPHCGAEPVVLSRKGGDPLPPPHEVAEWAATWLRTRTAPHRPAELVSAGAA
jgi:hypothetical protein